MEEKKMTILIKNGRVINPATGTDETLEDVYKRQERNGQDARQQRRKKFGIAGVRFFGNEDARMENDIFVFHAFLHVLFNAV